MINLLTSGLLLAIATVTPTPPCAVGVTVAPLYLCVPNPVPTPLPTLPIKPPAILPSPPVVIVPQPPAYTPPPYQPPVYQPPVYQPPVYQYTPPTQQPVPDVTTTPVHVQQLPSPTAHPTPVTHPAAVTLQTLKHLTSGAHKSPISVENPAEPAHRQPPFDNSIAGAIGNTAAQFPDFGWILLILAGLGIIVLNEKLDRAPRTKTIGRHSAKLK